MLPNTCDNGGLETLSGKQHDGRGNNNNNMNNNNPVFRTCERIARSIHMCVTGDSAGFFAANYSLIINFQVD